MAYLKRVFNWTPDLIQRMKFYFIRLKVSTSRCFIMKKIKSSNDCAAFVMLIV